MYQSLHEEIRGICKETGYPNKWLMHDFCPCCSNSRIVFFFKKIDMAYWICEKCKFVFLNPYPDRHTMDLIYNAEYYPAVRNFIEKPRALANFTEVSQSMADRYYFEIINLVKKEKTDGKWLDVGGGIGTFLNHVQNHSPNYTLFLNESNRDSFQFAEAYYKLKVLPVGPEKLLQDHHDFDIISMLSVLEHINRPFEFLAAYLKVLSRNGLLVLTVPNYTLFNRLFSRQHSYNVIPPYHLNLFNFYNIQLLLERLKVLNGIKIYSAGDSAFKLRHLARWSEYEDIKIPIQKIPQQEFVYHKRATFAQTIKLNGLGLLDRIFSFIFERVDGKIFMNILAHKDAGRN